MSCILRACGENFNVDRFLAETKLKPGAIYRKGDPRLKLKPTGKKNKSSGINFEVSQAGFHQLDRQIRDAIRYLQKHKNEIKKLVKYPGVEKNCELDFGIGTKPVAVQSDQFPPQLLLLAGNLGLKITVSRYP